MLQSLARFGVRRRRTVRAIWAMVMVAGVVAGGSVMCRLSTSFEGDGSMESVLVVERL